MKSASLLAGALVVASQLVGALAVSPSRVVVAPDVVKREKVFQTPSELPGVALFKSQGCWASNANMTVNKKVKSTEVSSGSCRVECQKTDYAVMAVQGQNCYCGYAMPEQKYYTKDSNCDWGCPAYPKEACGSRSEKYYSIFNLGTNIDPPIYEEKEEEDEKDDKSSTSSSAGPTSTNDPTPPSQTAKQSDSAESEDDKKHDGPNVAGIVAGSVVGVLAVAGGAFAIWFFMRRRRNSEIEEEHRRNAAVNAFISGSKPPGSSGSISMTDSRLDPVMAHRRMSDGSIADNEDYSRKILRVTNA